MTKTLPTEAEIHEHCDLIKGYISKARLGPAFDESLILIEMLQLPELESSVLYLRARYHQLERNGGLMHGAEKTVEYNQIIHEFLNFIASIDLRHNLERTNQKIEDIKLQVSRLSARLHLNIEIIKERINRLGECWSAIYTFETKIFRIVKDFLDELIEFEGTPPAVMAAYSAYELNRNLDNLYALLSLPELQDRVSSAELSAAQHEALLQEMRTAFVDYWEADETLERSKFWLGPDIYREARAYHNCYPRFLRQYEEKDYLACIDCLSEQRAAASSIERTVGELQAAVFGG